MDRLAEAMKNDIQYDEDAQMYLVDRRIPNDVEFFYDNDLGTVPNEMEHLLKKWLPEAKASAVADLAVHQEFIALWSEKVSQLRGAQKKKVLGGLEAAENAIDQTRSMFQRISENLELLTKPDWRGALCYVYRDPEGLVSSINVRQILNEYQTESHDSERRVIRIQPRRRGVFGGASMAFRPGSGWNGAAPPSVIVEGEHNRLALMAAIERWDVKYFIPIIAVGGKNGVDLACIRSLIGWEEDPLVVYDNDTINESTGMPGGYSLVEALATRLFMSVSTTPTKDLDEWFVKRERSPQEFLETISETAEPVAKSFASVAEEIQSMLETKGEPNQRTKNVTEIIVRDLRRRGTLYRTDGYTSALMRYQTKDLLIPVRKGMPAFNALMSRYGLVQPNWVDAAGMAINIAALDAPVEKVYSLSYFDDNHLYVNCYDDQMLRISPDGSVDKFPNGTDGILMCSPDPKIDPWLPEGIDLNAELSRRTGTLRVVPGSALNVQILDRINYETEPELHKQVLKAFLIDIFFGSSHKSRPTAIAEGPAASGKSTFGALVGTMLIGKSFTVTQPPQNQDDLAGLLQSGPFVGIDDWDKVSPEVESAFKHLTTGGTHKRRELYTTSQMVELPCTASIFLSANLNPMRAAGTSRRTIKVPVASRQHAVGEEVYLSLSDYLIPEFLKHRTTLWLDLVADLLVVVKALAQTDPATKTSFSMADFGTLVQRTANYEGWGTEATAMFKQLGAKQDEAAVQSLLLGSLLPLVLRDPDYRYEVSDGWRTAEEWTRLLLLKVDENDVESRRKITTHYVATMLKLHQEIFERKLGMETDYNKTTKIHRYKFTLPDEQTQKEDAA